MLPPSSTVQGVRDVLGQRRAATLPRVIVDASGYKFQIPAQIEVTAPDSESIVVGEGLMYAADWKPFVGIGHASKDDTAAKFAVIWVGMAEVK